MPPQMDLFETYHHRWGPGKVHVAVNLGTSQSPLWKASCRPTGSHGKHRKGTPDEVTCRKCSGQ